MEERASSRGRLITLEGPDGAGKSSQSVRLAQALRDRGHRVVDAREPGGTKLGEQVRALLLASDVQHEPVADALLFNAARAQLCIEVIGPALQHGEIVVCDRFTDSTLAYQGYGSGLDLRWLEELNDWATGGIRPGLTLLLDVAPEEGLRRRARGPTQERTRFEERGHHDLDFHSRVRDGYRALAGREPERWRIFDATADADVLATQILDVVSEWLATGEPSGQHVRIS